MYVAYRNFERRARYVRNGGASSVVQKKEKIAEVETFHVYVDDNARSNLPLKLFVVRSEENFRQRLGGLNYRSFLIYIE